MASRKTWKYITPLEIEVEIEENPHRQIFSQERTILTSSGIRLYRTSKIFENEDDPQLIAPMILDENDFEIVNQQLKGLSFSEQIQRVQTIEGFFSHFPNTKIYLRYFGYNKNRADLQVFTSEALEFVKMLMKRAIKPIWRWKCIAKQLKTCKIVEHNSGFSTMTIPKLAKFLKEFSIDASLFTLVPDFDYAHQAYYIGSFLPFTQPISLWGPTAAVTLHGTQHIFAIFCDIVMGVDWNTHLMCTEPYCRREFREAIIKTMNYYSEFEPEIYKKKSDYPKYVAELRSMRYHHISTNAEDVASLTFHGFDSTDRMRLCYFLSLCKRMGFASGPANHLEQFHRMHIPMWKVRVLFMILCADKFFDNEKRLEHLKKAILTAIASKIPCWHWDFPNDSSVLDILLSSDSDILEGERQAAVFNAKDIECVKAYHYTAEEDGNDKWFDRINFILCGKWEYVEMIGKVLEDTSSEIVRTLRDNLNDYKNKLMEDVEKNKERDDELTRKTNEVLRMILVEKVAIDSVSVTQEAHNTPTEDVESQLEPEIVEFFYNFRKRTLLQWKHARELQNIMNSAIEVHRSEEYRKELKNTQKMPFYTNCKPSTSSS